MTGKAAARIYIHFGRRLISKKVMQQLQILYPQEDIQTAVQNYYTQKLQLLIKVLLAGIAAAAVMGIRFLIPAEIVDGKLARGEYGEGDKVYMLSAVRQDGHMAERQVEVKERQYTEAETERLYEEMLPRLEAAVLGTNPGWDRITSSLRLYETFEPYPFSVKWSNSRADILGRDGTLEEIPESGLEIEITGEFEYGNFKRKQTWHAMVYPEDSAANEITAWEKALDEAIACSEADSMTQKEWVLPEMINGSKITWKKKQKYEGGKIMVLCLAAALASYCLKDRELERQVKKKNRRILAQYGTAVNKLAIYMGAGMTVRSAWVKTAAAQCKNGIYAEMIRTCQEMDSGLPETLCYERFGKRLGLAPCIRLGTMLAQNVKLGNRILLKQLKEEAVNAMEERRHQIKRAGEEAGTKLLGPMMLMLAIVLLLIMVPAFSGFGI